MSSTKTADKIAITICGDGGCGKSSITLRIVRSQWTSEYDPTIEDSYSVTRMVDGLSYHLALTDTAGQEEYRGLWASSNLLSDAFLLVYDVTNPQSLDSLGWFLDMIEFETENRVEQNKDLMKEKGMRVKGKVEQGWKVPPVTMIVGNKCDLNEYRTVASKTGWDFARSRGCGFMETSAKDMVNIEETFAWMVRKVTKARQGDTESKAKSPHAESGSYQSYGVLNTEAPPTREKRSRNQASTKPNSSQQPLTEKSYSDNGSTRGWRWLCNCFSRK